jgi:hypothetical protein
MPEARAVRKPAMSSNSSLLWFFSGSGLCGQGGTCAALRRGARDPGARGEHESSTFDNGAVAVSLSVAGGSWAARRGWAYGDGNREDAGARVLPRSSASVEDAAGRVDAPQRHSRPGAYRAARRSSPVTGSIRLGATASPADPSDARTGDPQRPAPDHGGRPADSLAGRGAPGAAPKKATTSPSSTQSVPTARLGRSPGRPRSP